MNRKTFIVSLLSAVGLGVATKEVKAAADSRLVGSGDIAVTKDYSRTHAELSAIINDSLKSKSKGERQIIFDEKGREFTYDNGRLVRSFTRGGFTNA
jgi:hypothetical protein